jgi:hypothetical protein
VLPEAWQRDGGRMSAQSGRLGPYARGCGHGG